MLQIISPGLSAHRQHLPQDEAVPLPITCSAVSVAATGETGRKEDLPAPA